MQLIDFCRTKAGQRDIQIFFDEELGKLWQLDRQPLTVPSGIAANFIVCKREGTLLSLREAKQLDRRDLPYAEKLCRFPATLSGYQGQGVVYQNGGAKAQEP